MAHGRVETTPEQQLAELRRAYERYAALADQLKDSVDPQIDAELLRARAQDARRIAHAYEKSIASTTMRLQSMHPPRGADARFGAMAVPLSLMLVAALLASGALVAYMRPELLRPLLARVMPQHAGISAPATAPMAKIIPVPAAPPAIVAALDAPPVPTARPAQSDDQPQLAATPKPLPKPVIAPPKPAAAPAPSPIITPPAAAKVTAPTPAKASAPVTAPSPRTAAPPVTAPPVAVPPKPAAAPVTPPAAAKASVPAAAAKASEPATILSPRTAPPPAALAKTPAPSVTAPPVTATLPAETITATPAAPPPVVVQPLAPPREVAPLPAPSPLAEPSAAAAPAATSTATPANSKLVPVLRTHLVPPYPAEAKRAGEQGTTQMQVTIGIDGSISDCRVSATSGSQRLDATACSFVQRYWRWVPPVRDGRPAPATTKVSVIWNLSPGDRP